MPKTVLKDFFKYILNLVKKNIILFNKIRLKRLRFRLLKLSKLFSYVTYV